MKFLLWSEERNTAGIFTRSSWMLLSRSCSSSILTSVLSVSSITALIRVVSWNICWYTAVRGWLSGRRSRWPLLGTYCSTGPTMISLGVRDGACSDTRQMCGTPPPFSVVAKPSCRCVTFARCLARGSTQFTKDISRAKDSLATTRFPRPHCGWDIGPMLTSISLSLSAISFTAFWFTGGVAAVVAGAGFSSSFFSASSSYPPSLGRWIVGKDLDASTWLQSDTDHICFVSRPTPHIRPLIADVLESGKYERRSRKSSVLRYYYELCTRYSNCYLRYNPHK